MSDEIEPAEEVGVSVPEPIDEPEPEEPEPVVEEAPDTVCLSYVGDGRHYVLGVPKRDLHEFPGERALGLVSTGLYEVRADCAHGAEAPSEE